MTWLSWKSCPRSSFSAFPRASALWCSNLGILLPWSLEHFTLLVLSLPQILFLLCCFLCPHSLPPLKKKKKTHLLTSVSPGILGLGLPSLTWDLVYTPRFNYGIHAHGSWISQGPRWKARNNTKYFSPTQGLTRVSCIANRFFTI